MEEKNIDPKDKPLKVNHKGCQNLLGLAIPTGFEKFWGFIIIFLLSIIAHHLLRPLAQSQITSDIVVSSILF